MPNTIHYRKTPLEIDKQNVKYDLFPAKVLTIDYERKVCTLEDLRNNQIYVEVNLMPAVSSSQEATTVFMPEPGSKCVATNLFYQGGFSSIVILTWLFSEATKALDAIAFRPFDGVQGWNLRKRGVYRKAYPGQATTTISSGYTEKLDSGWDQAAADLSRDHLDVNSRTRKQTTGTYIEYSDAGISVSGSAVRPNAAGIIPRVLPDGSLQFTVFLTPSASIQDRYVEGKPDVVPFSEKLELVQEFSLDYPIPEETLGTELMDKILGRTEDFWGSTTVTTTAAGSFDSQSFLINQTWDHPYDSKAKSVGPALQEGPTPSRKGFILEKVAGTLVGYNSFDKTTYGKVLKPTLFPYTQQGRFSSNVESGYLGVNDSPRHSEARLASSAYSLRFPYEVNTTRLDITKEGFTSFEIGSTIPKENNKFQEGYEHPHGAGRSLEGHFVGSVKLVVGKNRDEEDSIDLQTLGQTVFRLGADDSSLPDTRRAVLTQNRSNADAVAARQVQYWSSSKLNPGDSGDLGNKTGAENISLRMATDGGIVARFGARNPNSLRKHLMNGYQDGPGKLLWGTNDSNRKDSRTEGRPTYGSGDNIYAFHDLTKAAQPQVNMLPYNWSGNPTPNGMDQHGLSVDFHAVRDILIRAGANEGSGQSVLLDLAGGIAAWLGKDKQGRSITATLDGGVEMVILPNKQGKALRIEFTGDIDWTVKGNFHLNVTGSTVFNSMEHVHNVKTDFITSGQRIVEKALVRHTTEAVDIVHNQGLYFSTEDATG